MKPAFPDIKGNDALRRLLGDDICSGRLSHAYILEGPRGSGSICWHSALPPRLLVRNGVRTASPLPCMTCPCL